jgi:hypothetical protein
MGNAPLPVLFGLDTEAVVPKRKPAVPPGLSAQWLLIFT